MMLRLGLLRSWMERNAFVAALGVRPGGTSLLTEGRRTLRRLPTRHKTSFLSDGTNPGARLFSHKINQAETSPIEPSERPLPEPMSNLYCEWSVEQDRLLYDNRHESLPTLASLLGRGLKGVELRLEKLKDVNSPAYERLFSGLPDSSSSSDKKQFDSRGGKLVPSREVLRRIQYDVSLSMGDFTVLHYDRVDDTIVESPMDAPNDSIAGPETQLLLALPEHRVVAVKYKERIVWDRETKVDRVFGSMGSNGETIDVVMATYDEWKRRKDATEEWNRQQQAAVSNRIRQMLGLELFTMLKHKSISLQETSADSAGVLQKNDVELYVQAALGFFRETRRDPGRRLEPTLIPMTDIDALYTFSELAALLPNAALRESILIEVSRLINRLEGKKCPSLENYQLPELDEDELVESFVRGSGAGGQKINKTSNRVVLIHEPTQVRVECQDTRSLQQNRKIARKRLRMKLDEYLNGTDSKASLKIQKAVQKKQRAKARTRARQARKNK